jgi:hypothetical protein
MGEGGLLQRVVGLGTSGDGGWCFIQREGGGDGIGRGTWWLGEVC